MWRSFPVWYLSTSLFGGGGGGGGQKKIVQIVQQLLGGARSLLQGRERLTVLGKGVGWGSD